MNHVLLHDVVRFVIGNIDLVIDKTHYPVETGRKSNLRHRPIGLGVQGMADLVMRIRVSFESEEAKRINQEIFETI